MRQRGEFAEELLSCVGAIFGFASGFLQDLLAEAEKGTCDGVRVGSDSSLQLAFLRQLEANVGCAGGHASRLERI